MQLAFEKSKLKRICICFSAMFILGPCSTMVFAGLLKDAQSTVGLIKVVLSQGQGIGTGFLYSSEKWIYLVSANHVIPTDSDSCTFSSRRTEGEDVTVITISIKKAEKEGVVFRNTQRDIIAIRLGQCLSSPCTWGDRYSTIAGNIGRMYITPRENVLKYADVIPTAEVILAGFPIEGEDELLRLSINNVHPFFRKGIVASKIPEKMKIIVDGGTIGGLSGGPVFSITHTASNVTEFRTIGIIQGFIPLTFSAKDSRDLFRITMWQNSEFSIIEPMDSILDLINSSEK